MFSPARAKGSRPALPPAPPSEAGTLSAADRTRARAYEIYLARCPIPPDAVSDWLRAERQIDQEVSGAIERPAPEQGEARLDRIRACAFDFFQRREEDARSDWLQAERELNGREATKEPVSEPRTIKLAQPAGQRRSGASHRDLVPASAIKSSGAGAATQGSKRWTA